MKKNPRIVNVIELVEGIITGIDTFVIPTAVNAHSKDEQEIVDIAEKLFASKAKANGMEEDDLEACLDDGYFEGFNEQSMAYKVIIHWSNEDTHETVKNL